MLQPNLPHPPQPIRCRPLHPAAAYFTAKLDKAALIANNGQTAGLAAFVGGFASYQMSIPADPSNLERAMFLLIVFSVHACLCSALTSAMLHRCLANMGDDEAIKCVRAACSCPRMT